MNYSATNSIESNEGNGDRLLVVELSENDIPGTHLSKLYQQNQVAVMQ